MTDSAQLATGTMGIDTLDPPHRELMEEFVETIHVNLNRD